MSLEDYLSKLGNSPEAAETEVEETEEQATEEVETTEEETEETEEETEEETSEETEETEEEQQEETPAQAEVDIDTLPVDKKLAIANKLFGMDFKDEAEVEAFKTKLANLESGSKNADLIPKLVEKLKANQNILSYFPDETAYVVAQLAKQEDMKGKEPVIDAVLRSNIAELPSLKVIELASRLEAPQGIRNPFRARLANLGLDPDVISEGYDSLSEDDKDRIDLLAAADRKSLSKLGKDVEIPKTQDVDVLAEIEAEVSRSREDLATKRTSIAPISQALVDELKELEITDGFKFALNLTKEEKQEYQNFITDAVVSGEYDLSTDKGKKEMWEAVKDLVRINNWDKIVTSLTKHVREEEQHNSRVKSSNAKPLSKNEPAPPKQTTSKLSAQAQAAHDILEANR